MPIPQPFSQSDIRTGSTGPQASADSFGNNGMDKLAKGLSILGMGVMQFQENREAIADLKKKKDDKLWVQRQTSVYSRALADFESDPTNNTRGDFLDKFADHSSKLTEELGKDAPSPEAYDAYLEQVMSTADSRYPRTAGAAAQNQLAEDMLGLDESWGLDMVGFHALAKSDPKAAGDDLLDRFDTFTNTINETYGAMSPRVGNEIIRQKAKDMIIGLSQYDPSRAARLLKELNYFSEGERRALSDQIGTNKTKIDYVARDNLDLKREQALIAAQKTGKAVLPELSEYEMAYGNDENQRATAMLLGDKRKLDSFSEAHSFIQQNKGVPLKEKVKAAEDLESKADTADKMQAFGQVIAPALTREQQLLEKDRVAWLSENNIAVSAQVEHLADLESQLENQGDEASPELVAEVRKAQHELFSSIVKYQGPPPEDAPNKDIFLDLPLDERRVMSSGEADMWASRINGSDPDQAMAVVNQLLERYPTDTLRYHALRDLSEMPAKPISQEFQAIFQNREQPFLPKLINAVRNKTDLEAMTDISRQKLFDEITTNKRWARFTETMIGSDVQRIGEIKGFQDSVALYARSMMAEGMKPDDAVDAALTDIIESTLAPVDIIQPWEEGIFFASRHKDHLYLPRKKSDGSLMSDEEAKDIGRRLGKAMQHINPREIDRGLFGLDNPALTDMEKDEVIDRTIRKDGRWQLYDDKLMMLMVPDTTGNRMIPLRDRNGNTLLAPWESIPMYRRVNQPKGTNIKADLGALDYDEVPLNGELTPDFKQSANGYAETGKFWIRKP